MNYQHYYHAGNIADVFKHILLCQLLKALLKKDKSFAYMDVFAGSGLYDLKARASQKTQEYLPGIALLWQQTNLPREIAEYLDIVKIFNANRNELRFYPGSPAIAQKLLRPNDRLLLNDSEKAIARELKNHFKTDPRSTLSQQDAFAALNAWLPPRERRGLVLLDPPFEKPDEFKNLLTGLKAAVQKWPSGIFACWYPIKNTAQIQSFLRQTTNLPAKDILNVCFNPLPMDVGQRLTGSGMLIVNPPWQFEQGCRTILSTLKNTLGNQGSYQVRWLKNLDPKGSPP